MKKAIEKQCSPGASCHERAPRGAKTGLQGIVNKDWEKMWGSCGSPDRGRIPPALFEEILAYCFTCKDVREFQYGRCRECKEVWAPIKEMLLKTT